jgi:hypothetical protein
VFVSRAIFPGAEAEPERSLEEHYLRHRKIILILLTVPTIVSVTSHVLLDQVHYQGLDVWWVAGRIILPLALIPFARLAVQRFGLAALNIVQLIGLLEGLFR